MEMTQREFLTKVVSLVNGEEIDCSMQDMQDYAIAQIDKLDAKNEKRKTTLTATQKENEVLKDKIVELVVTKNVTAKEVATALEISTQKASALLQLLEKNNIVKSNELKQGKSKVKSYSIA